MAPRRTFLDTLADARAAGTIDGRHYSEHPATVAALKAAGRIEEAAALLERLIGAAEAEAAVYAADRPDSRWRLPPWFFVQLAIVRRAQRRYADEIAVCDRFVTDPRGGAHADLEARRARARVLLAGGR